MRGAPEPGAPAPATGHSPRILFMTAFTIDFSRFEVHFSCSAGVLRRDSISAHIWYGLRTNFERAFMWRYPSVIAQMAAAQQIPATREVDLVLDIFRSEYPSA